MDPPRLCRAGKRKLTESAKEFPKASTRDPLLPSLQRVMSPEGSLREAQVAKTDLPVIPFSLASTCAGRRTWGRCSG